jgi:bifunctional non-homologous end joining protein LigD
VKIWDEGTYQAEDTADLKTSEARLLQGLEKGSLTFVLKGQLLRGAFTLIKMKKGPADSWLLIKLQDVS